jgi:uncharacterized protein
MDKIAAVNIVTAYLRAIPREKYALTKAFLFGSYARNRRQEESDIDLAIVLQSLSDPYTAQIEFMYLRRAFDLRIEPHLFQESQFNDQNPLAFEILKHGQEIDLT